MENEQADAGRDGQTCFMRPNSQAQTETGKNTFFLCIQLTMGRIGNHNRLTAIYTIYSLLHCCTSCGCERGEAHTNWCLGLSKHTDHDANYFTTLVISDYWP